MGSITYIKGDATCPQSKGLKIICHVCNDVDNATAKVGSRTVEKTTYFRAGAK